MPFANVGRTAVFPGLIWNGDEIRERVHEAAKAAVNMTMARCVAWSHAHHGYNSETHHLVDATQVWEPALELADKRIRGSWGAKTHYALFVEIGTSRPWSGGPTAPERAAMAGGDMWMIPPPLPPGHHTDTVWRTEAGVVDDFGTAWRVRRKIPGQGPLMEPRTTLRYAASIEYPMLAERIRQHLHGELMT